MQFGFAHRALEAEEEAVIELRGVIEAIFIEDEGLGQGAQLQQPVPVAGVLLGRLNTCVLPETILGALRDSGFAEPRHRVLAGFLSDYVAVKPGR